MEGDRDLRNRQDLETDRPEGSVSAGSEAGTYRAKTICFHHRHAFHLIRPHESPVYLLASFRLPPLIIEPLKVQQTLAHLSLSVCMRGGRERCRRSRSVRGSTGDDCEDEQWMDGC